MSVQIECFNFLCEESDFFDRFYELISKLSLNSKLLIVVMLTLQHSTDSVKMLKVSGQAGSKMKMTPPPRSLSGPLAIT